MKGGGREKTMSENKHFTEVDGVARGRPMIPTTDTLYRNLEQGEEDCDGGAVYQWRKDGQGAAGGSGRLSK